MNPDQRHLTGPFLVTTPNHCTACGNTLTAVLILGSKEAVLCCDGCGRRGVHCSCQPSALHPCARVQRERAS